MFNRSQAAVTARGSVWETKVSKSFAAMAFEVYSGWWMEDGMHGCRKAQKTHLLVLGVLEELTGLFTGKNTGLGGFSAEAESCGVGRCVAAVGLTGTILRAP